MDKKKEVLSARSRENGIVFLSSKFPALCYEAYIDDNGEVKTGVLPTMISNIKDFGGFIRQDVKKGRRIQAVCKIAILLLAVLSIILTRNISIAIALLYFSLIALKDTIEFSETVLGLKLGKYKSVARFHSAEHMVIGAYEKYQRVPTMEEVKKSSRFDKNCSSRRPINKILIFGLVAVLISFCTVIESWLYFTLLIALVVFTYFQQKYNMCKFLQVLVTSKPTEKELEVALAGIEFFDKMEEGVPDTGCPIAGIILSIDIYDEDEEEGSDGNLN